MADPLCNTLYCCLTLTHTTPAEEIIIRMIYYDGILLPQGT